MWGCGIVHSDGSCQQAKGRVVAERGLAHLAERLNFLFDYVPNPDGGRYSNTEVATGLQANGVPTTPTYMSQLRSGTRDNPSATIVAGLADLFGIPLTYFFDEQVASDTQNELATMTAMRDSRVRAVLTRAVGASDDDGLNRALHRALETMRNEDEKETRGDGDDSPDPDNQ